MNFERLAPSIAFSYISTASSFLPEIDANSALSKKNFILKVPLGILGSVFDYCKGLLYSPDQRVLVLSTKHPNQAQPMIEL
mmetsp:Transcript_16458/g.31478  ORF Transcript_16458/g.31478 Transcript_16458/m.31478 type:complete len:81 (-) Transcript_16458:197-439(-)